MRNWFKDLIRYDELSQQFHYSGPKDYFNMKIYGNSIIRTLGQNVLWLNEHQSALEQVCAEFKEDEDDDDRPMPMSPVIDKRISGKDSMLTKTNKSFIQKSTNQSNQDDESDSSFLQKSFKQPIIEEDEDNKTNKLNLSKNSDSVSTTTPRIQLGKKTLDPKKRLIDPMSKVAPMTKAHVEKPREFGKSKMMQKSMGAVKDVIKSEL